MSWRRPGRSAISSGNKLSSMRPRFSSTSASWNASSARLAGGPGSAFATSGPKLDSTQRRSSSAVNSDAKRSGSVASGCSLMLFHHTPPSARFRRQGEAGCAEPVQPPRRHDPLRPFVVAVAAGTMIDRRESRDRADAKGRAESRWPPALWAAGLARRPRRVHGSAQPAFHRERNVHHVVPSLALTANARRFLTANARKRQATSTDRPRTRPARAAPRPRTTCLARPAPACPCASRAR